MVDTSRYFENTFKEYNGDVALLGSDKRLTGKISDDITSFLTSKFNDLCHVYRTPIEKKKFDSSHDSSVYTGNCGIVMLAQKISDYNNTEWDTSLAFHKVLLNKASLRKKRITFLCGDAGPLALYVMQCKLNNDKTGMKKYADELSAFASWSSEREMDNEVLYGRAGYLYALLFVKQIDNDLIPDSVVLQIVNDLIDVGLKGVKRDSVLPLYYEWHGKEYIGAAHGYIGILYMLLQTNTLYPGTLKQKHEELVVGCLDAVLNQRFPSGNMRSSMGSESDCLIHWCHGAPGAVHLYALAYKIYKKPLYLSACKGFADAVWSRGLLRRGYGICHGVAGNGYASLCMYQLTGDEQYLWRAMKFAEWCLLYGQHDCRTPDSPYSLFEGLAGTLYFLHDILKPESARFPAFQLVSYS